MNNIDKGAFNLTSVICSLFLRGLGHSRCESYRTWFKKELLKDRTEKLTLVVLAKGIHGKVRI
jgi:hypothetical protein